MKCCCPLCYTLCHYLFKHGFKVRERPSRGLSVFIPPLGSHSSLESVEDAVDMLPMHRISAMRMGSRHVSCATPRLARGLKSGTWMDKELAYDTLARGTSNPLDPLGTAPKQRTHPLDRAGSWCTRASIRTPSPVPSSRPSTSRRPTFRVSYTRPSQPKPACTQLHSWCHLPPQTPSRSTSAKASRTHAPATRP